MLKKTIVGVVALSLIFFADMGISDASEYKLSVFNFGTLNMEASGLGTSVTNLLISVLKNDPSISLLDRKDLETFLSLNDLQQNDKLDNVVNIGSRLGLDFVVVGSVDKRGSAININCSLIQIDKKKEVYSTRVRAFGESALTAEIVKLGSLITSVLNKNSSAGAAAGSAASGDEAVINSPVNFQKFPGNKKIILRWQGAPRFDAAGYEVYRGLNSNGPFAMLGQTDKLEYSDQNVENNTAYFYKVRAFDKLSRLSDFTSVLGASTDFAPNPPIILKTEGHAKSILIVWVHNPSKSLDTSKFFGYRIYRAKAENDPYQEIAKLSVADLSGNADEKMYYRDMALPSGSIYFYRLAAFNEKNIESELCYPVKGTVLAGIASVNTQSGLIREVKVTWTGVQSPFIVAYNIYRSLKADGNFTKIKKISAAELKDNFTYSDRDGLGDKTNYYYYVTAEDDLGIETSYPPAAVAITRDIPPQPEKFVARSRGLVKKVELTWQAAKQEEVEGYNIYWASEKDGLYNLLKKINGRENNTYMDESRGFDNLVDNKIYYYSLRAYNRVAAESLPALAYATTKPRPQKPEGLNGRYGAGKAEISWSSNKEANISHYVVYEKVFFGVEKIAQVKSTNYSDGSIVKGKSKTYVVSAVDNSGLESEISSEFTVSAK